MSAWAAVGRTKLSYEGLTNRRYLEFVSFQTWSSFKGYLLVKDPINCPSPFVNISSDTTSQHEIRVGLNEDLAGMVNWVMTRNSSNEYLEVVQGPQCRVYKGHDTFSYCSC